MNVSRAQHPGLLPVKAAEASGFFFIYQKAVLSPGYSAWNNLALFDISDIEVGWG